MMPDVADHDVGQGANAHFVAARNASSFPGVIREVLEEAEVRMPDGLKFGKQAGRRTKVKITEIDIRVLVEAGHRRRIAAGEPEGAAAEDALRIDQVANNLLDAPGV